MKKFTNKAVTKLQAVILIVIIVVVAVSGAAIYTINSPTAATVIKIGWPDPLTGALASFGEPDSWIAQKVTDYVNNQNGGVYISSLGKKLPIQIIVKNTESDINKAAQVANDLINKDHVDLMVVGHTAEVVVPVSEECEKYGVPCIALDCPVLSWLHGAPYTWSYLGFWAEPDAAAVFVGMWDQVKDQTNTKVAGIWSNDTDGKTIQECVSHIAAQKGYTYTDLGLVSYGTTDYSSYITTCKENDINILTGGMSPPDFAVFWKQCADMGYTPKVATVARAILFPSSVEALGDDLAAGLSCENWWSAYHPFNSSLTGWSAQELCMMWEEESGKQWTAPMGYALGLFDIAVDAITRAGSLDKTAIRDAIANTDLDTIVGPINFKTPLTADQAARYEAWPQLAQYKDHYCITPVVGMQWVKGTTNPWEPQIVYQWEYQKIPKTANMTLMPGSD